MCNLAKVIDLLWSTLDFQDPKVLVKCVVCRKVFVCHYHDSYFGEFPQVNDIFVIEIEFGRRGRLVEVSEKKNHP